MAEWLETPADPVKSAHQPETALRRQTGIGRAKHGYVGLGWWDAPHPMATSTLLVTAKTC